MRYILLGIDLDVLHPLWPHERVYKWKDVKTGWISYGCWINKEIAEEIVKRKNDNI